MTKQYRTQPMIVEAMQWTRNNDKEIKRFLGKSVSMLGSGIALIDNLNGSVIAAHGDYIIKGVNGEFYPCKPDIFAKTYQDIEKV
jgi:hypothetical protein